MNEPAEHHALQPSITLSSSHQVMGHGMLIGSEVLAIQQSIAAPSIHNSVSYTSIVAGTVLT